MASFAALPSHSLMIFFLLVFFFLLYPSTSASCPPHSCQLLDSCSNAAHCSAGLYCGSCPASGNPLPACVRGQANLPTAFVNGLPFNRYTWLVTHNSFSIVNAPSYTGSQRVTFYNQDDSVTNQLRNGVRGLMLDMYDFENDIWLCHSFQGQCYNFTAFEPAINTLKEVEAFLTENPSEIVTIIIEDYVRAPKGLSKLFSDAGLTRLWYPVSEMPTNGMDWPSVTDMVAKNRRLLVFTSDSSKEASEGIAYQWRYMVENEPAADKPSTDVLARSYILGWKIEIGLYEDSIFALRRHSSSGSGNLFGTELTTASGFNPNRGSVLGLASIEYSALAAGDPGIVPGSCPNRKESQPLNSKYASLFLQNYFPTMPVENEACKEHTMGFAEMVDACYRAAGIMPNFLAVNFYMRSYGGGVFDIQDRINGLSLCGCGSITACQVGAPMGVCKNTGEPNRTSTISGGTYSGYVQLSGSSSTSIFSGCWVVKLLVFLLPYLFTLDGCSR